MSKKNAFDFFIALENYLNQRIPDPDEIAQKVSAIVKDAKELNTNKHLAFPEAAFLNHFIVPTISEYLTTVVGMSIDDAKHALLSESFRSLNSISSGTPARSRQHPFSKAIGISTKQIVGRWKKPGRGSVVQSCPDFALRPPAPFKIVFEGKYFVKGNAETALAEGIYQTFFYRGLPFVPETPSHPAWDYDFGCYVAYDASPKGSLAKAWRSLNQKVHVGCWDGANIYIMILRGNPGQIQ